MRDQAAGEITTGARSKVVLSGGVTAASVFWVSATSLNTGVASIFQGTALMKTKITIAGNVTGGLYAQTSIGLMATKPGCFVIPPGACKKPDGTCFAKSCSSACNTDGKD